MDQSTNRNTCPNPQIQHPWPGRSHQQHLGAAGRPFACRTFPFRITFILQRTSGNSACHRTCHRSLGFPLGKTDTTFSHSNLPGKSPRQFPPQNLSCVRVIKEFPSLMICCYSIHNSHPSHGLGNWKFRESENRSHHAWQGLASKLVLPNRTASGILQARLHRWASAIRSYLSDCGMTLHVKTESLNPDGASHPLIPLHVKTERSALSHRPCSHRDLVLQCCRRQNPWEVLSSSETWSRISSGVETTEGLASKKPSSSL